MKLWPVRHGEGVVVRHLFFINPLSYFVLKLVLDVTTDEPLLHTTAVGWRPASLDPALVNVCITLRTFRKLLQNEQTRQTLGPAEATFKYCRIDARSIKIWPLDLEATVSVFGQAVLIRRRATCEVDRIDLCHVGGNGAWTRPDLFAVECGTAAVDVEASQDLADGFVDS